MSILMDPDAFPQAIQAVYDLICLRPCGDDELTQWLAPQAQVAVPDKLTAEGSSVLRAALNKAQDFGLIRREGDAWQATMRLHSSAEYHRQVRQGAVMSQPKFVDAARWLLSQDAFEVPAERTWEDHQQAQTDLTTFISNDTQFVNFRRWVVYLGLGREQAGYLMPDPTAALLEEWPALCPEQEMTAAAFYARVQEVLPMFPDPQHDRLPSSASFALVVLERRKQLQFEHHADTEKLSLTVPGLPRLFSHVRSGQVSA
ncbi:hypothetical protein GCM10010841_26790 [Deinococcus aerophilus]|uniref:Uncharacterized protein n=2 Tax=Deinococcus aerophilus TaxID=522488 RepID=A0ABQ2GYE7_9DEIO|nr:hypothetical protein GCM10010841_26790 [Deinococcus aerophilus]